MELVKFTGAPIYSAPGHEEVVARRLQGGEASTAKFAMVGHSSFPARAVVPMDAGSSFGKIYVVTQGVLTVEQADGVRHRLEPGDSIFVPAGESRAVLNESEGPAAMIVVAPSPP